MAVCINFITIQINSLENDAGVFFGENVQSGWDSHSKNNQAMGQVFGNLNATLAPINIINDSDVIDSPVNDQDLEGNLCPAIAKVI